MEFCWAKSPGISMSWNLEKVISHNLKLRDMNDHANWNSEKSSIFDGSGLGIPLGLICPTICMLLRLGVEGLIVVTYSYEQLM
uniref:Uncharacterized protein n=1 Tax=Romanomermis culicivorax TaxID=13658 RepID=A0A915KKU6_ROMCU